MGAPQHNGTPGASGVGVSPSASMCAWIDLSMTARPRRRGGLVRHRWHHLPTCRKNKAFAKRQGGMGAGRWEGVLVSEPPPVGSDHARKAAKASSASASVVAGYVSCCCIHMRGSCGGGVACRGVCT